MKSVRHHSPSLALEWFLVAVAATPLGAQIPAGYQVVSAFWSPGSAFPGPGGVYVAHPRSGAPMQALTGVPGPLTGTNGAETGANSVVLHPSGDLLVGEVALPGQTVGVWRLTLSGLSVAGTTYFPLGTGVAGGTCQVAQMHLLGPQTLLLGCSDVALAGGAAPLQIVLLDLATGAVTELLNGTGLGRLNALAFDPASQTVVFAALSGGGAVSTIQQMPLAGGTVATLATLTGGVTGLAVTANGQVFATVGFTAAGPNPALALIAANGATPLVTNWALFNSLCVEPATGHLALVGTQFRTGSGPQGVHRFDRTMGALTWLTGSLVLGPRGAVSGIACAPDSVPYGAPSGPVLHPWSAAPRADALPVAGQLWTAAVDWAGNTPLVSVVVLAGGAPAGPLPLPGGLSCLVDPTSLVGTAVMTLDAFQQASLLTVPLPAGLAGVPVFLQSFHVTRSAQIAASDGLRADIL